jgi:hypothetical protein
LADEYEADEGDAANLWWANRIAAAAQASFERCCRALETESRGFRAAAQAAPRFQHFLNEALAALQPEPPDAPTAELEEVSR